MNMKLTVNFHIFFPNNTVIENVHNKFTIILAFTQKNEICQFFLNIDHKSSAFV